MDPAEALNKNPNQSSKFANSLGYSGIETQVCVGSELWTDKCINALRGLQLQRKTGERGDGDMEGILFQEM
jgi:hypothetical protein